jgi:IrrE N-terminal-like domain
MGGNSSKWDPWVWLEERHPDVQVVILPLRDRVRGCVDVDRRIIWLHEALSPTEARWVLAYEIGQLQAGRVPADPCQASAHQRDASDWAARMLIESDDLAAAFAQRATIPGVAEWLGEDEQAVRVRLRGMSDAEQDAVMSSIYSLHHRESA